jgi:small subunit ribosomal protein S6
MLFARNDVRQQQVEGIIDRIASELKIEDGALTKQEYWGLRSLAYRIRKNRRGYYVLLGLDAARPRVATSGTSWLRWTKSNSNAASSPGSQP